MAELFVIIGAGASHDCAGTSALRIDESRPPLVKDLFNTNFAPILHRYPLAEAASADIRLGVASESVALEKFLRERLRDSDDPYAQKRFFQVPLYLQELLFRVGQTDGSGYTTHPDNYDALVNACLALERVSFITLNYDTLLDQRLFIYSKLDSLVSYTNEKERWALFKLHGSVNWGRQMNTAALVDARAGTPGDFINRLFDERREGGVADTITFRSKGTVEEMRYEGRGLFYPALSVPLGSADELICPTEHVDLLRDRLANAGDLNLLVIGYSGLDQEVMNLLAESGSGLRSLLVVNGAKQASFEAAEKIASRMGIGGVQPDWFFNGGFSDLVVSGRLSEYVGSLN